jgi:hypothetical protein
MAEKNKAKEEMRLSIKKSKLENMKLSPDRK